MFLIAFYLLCTIVTGSLIGLSENSVLSLPHNEHSKKRLQNNFNNIEQENTLTELVENFSGLTTNNPCLVHYCAKGKECKLNSLGQAECVCQRWCTHRKKPVCGSDGIIYENHCLLHRVSCYLDKSLNVDRMETCMNREVLSSTQAHEPIIIYKETTQMPIQTTASTKDISSTSEEAVATTTVTNDNAIVDEILKFGFKKCSPQEYEIMKDNLLLYSHARLMSHDNNHSKDFLVSIMFSHYDQNNNGHLDSDELRSISLFEHLDELSNGCALQDMIIYDDTDHDGQLSVTEFNQAFSKLYSVSVVSLDKSLEINHLSARVQDNVEIKCDVTGSPSPPIVWKRNGIDLSLLNEDEIRVFTDGSLYLTRIKLIHAGNYTCHAQRNKDIVQTHILTVHTIPKVFVVPRIQSKRPNEKADIICRAIGEPFPQIQWLKNDEYLPNKSKFQLLTNDSQLQITQLTYSDTGAYMCQVTNSGGKVRDISSLVVTDDPTPTVLVDEQKFVVFHEYGIAVYEPDACRLYHQIHGTDKILGTPDYVCGEKGARCSWGQAIHVSKNYIYVSQPENDRVLIMSLFQMLVIESVSTDRYPVDLHYVPHFDQVWVVNWRSKDQNADAKTIQVIRDVTQKRKHYTVHPEPIDAQFDLVKNLFIPSADLEMIDHVGYKYGYVTHKNQRGLYKIDLANLRYTRSIDLTMLNCVPENIVFSAVYGYVVISCREPITNRPQGQIIMDYVTDTVLSMKSPLTGIPKISPDSRSIATVDHTRDSVKIIVQRIKQNGLEFEFDVKTSLNISDVTFFESQTTNGYDLYASASDKDDILFLNLYTGKVEMISGVGNAQLPSGAWWNNPIRPIEASGMFGKYMVTSASNAIFVINGKTRTINCEIGGVPHPTLMLWIHSNTHQQEKPNASDANN